MKRRLSKIAMGASIFCLLLFGCSHFNPTAPASEKKSVLPDINHFSSTKYEDIKYAFPPIESASYIHDGITEILDINDPRLYRLLNAISFSYENGYTAWRQGHVEEDEFLSYINSDVPMLDIYFQLGDISANQTEFSQTPRAVICANRYLLIVDSTNSSWMPNGVIYANIHDPFLTILSDPNQELENEAWQKLASNAQWGDTSFLNLLEYAGF